jgi:hypothetical protein
VLPVGEGWGGLRDRSDRDLYPVFPYSCNHQRTRQKELGGSFISKWKYTLRRKYKLSHTELHHMGSWIASYGQPLKEGKIIHELSDVGRELVGIFPEQGFTSLFGPYMVFWRCHGLRCMREAGNFARLMVRSCHYNKTKDSQLLPQLAVLVPAGFHFWWSHSFTVWTVTWCPAIIQL